MKDEYFKTAEPATGGLCSTAVERFARDVVARLVSRTDRGGEVLRTALVDQLVDSVRQPWAVAASDLCQELKRLRISPDVFADYYIPEAARKLGLGWEEDNYSFAEVTMGVARLQAILREIGVDWQADKPVDDGLIGASSGPIGGTMLVILPAGEQHTLGAMVMAGKLRRLGISVCLQVAPTPDGLARLLAERHFDGALISLTAQNGVDACQKLVKTLKDASGNKLGVAIGGATLGTNDALYRNIGADVVTNDLSEAIVALGMAPMHSVADAVK